VLVRIRILVAREEGWVLGRIRIKRMMRGGESRSGYTTQFWTLFLVVLLVGQYKNKKLIFNID
jgi:hypothetical protein